MNSSEIHKAFEGCDFFKGLENPFLREIAGLGRLKPTSRGNTFTGRANGRMDLRPCRRPRLLGAGFGFGA
jgi:hypothetical protein